MPVLTQFADLAQPQLFGQMRATLGQLHRHHFASGQPDRVRGELLGPPIVFGKLVITQNRDPLLTHRLEQLRTVAFAVEHHSEPMGTRIAGQPPLLLDGLRHAGLQPRNHILLERGDQSRVHFLIHVEKRLAVHGVDPVIDRRPQA